MTPPRDSSGVHGRPEAGISLVQVLVAASILALAALSLSATQLQSMALTTTNRETTVARQVARQILEEIQNVPPDEAYARFNVSTSDDPDGPGTATGSTIGVSTEAGDMLGTIVFPGTTTLREDVTDEALGMPMDLNGDGDIDSDDHAEDYRLLPVRIRVQWTGVKGTRTLDMHALILNP